jgi:cellular nucleic acid-binding protein
MVFIYIIQLEQGKYYIGKTNNPQFRLESHFNSNGSEWTKIYKPLRVIELKPNCDDYDEDKITRQYMDKYGINNVRGGSFVSVKLEKSTIDTLKKMSNGTNNKCFVCGKSGHFVKDCQENKCCENYSDKEYELVWCCEYCGEEFMKDEKCKKHEKKCDKNNEKCNCPTSYFSPHRKIKCFLKNEVLCDESDDYNNCCFRCGRLGHYSSTCYASKHIKGYYLKN